jgi:hypothetical protein
MEKESIHAIKTSFSSSWLFAAVKSKQHKTSSTKKATPTEVFWYILFVGFYISRVRENARFHGRNRSDARSVGVIFINFGKQNLQKKTRIFF